jgi:hypothetical protein
MKISLMGNLKGIILTFSFEEIKKFFKEKRYVKGFSKRRKSGEPTKRPCEVESDNRDSE